MKSWRSISFDKGLTVISDPGLDDLVALLLLERLVPNVPKLLVATFGNISRDATAQNARDFVRVMGGNWYYRDGAAMPENGVVVEPWLDGEQGKSGLWDIRPEGINTVRDDPSTGQAQVISLGALTDTARLLRHGVVEDLLVMGCLLDWESAYGPPAELNVLFDAKAAEYVFENAQLAKVSVVPADIALSAIWTEEDVRDIPETSEINRWLKSILLAGFKNGRYSPEKPFRLYDPVAIYLAFYPEAARWLRKGIAVSTDDQDYGCTRLDDTRPRCNIAVAAPSQRELARTIYQLTFGEELL